MPLLDGLKNIFRSLFQLFALFPFVFGLVACQQPHPPQIVFQQPDGTQKRQVTISDVLKGATTASGAQAGAHVALGLLAFKSMHQALEIARFGDQAKTLDLCQKVEFQNQSDSLSLAKISSNEKACTSGLKAQETLAFDASKTPTGLINANSKTNISQIQKTNDSLIEWAPLTRSDSTQNLKLSESFTLSHSQDSDFAFQYASTMDFNIEKSSAINTKTISAVLRHQIEAELAKIQTSKTTKANKHFLIKTKTTGSFRLSPNLDQDQIQIKTLSIEVTYLQNEKAVFTSQTSLDSATQFLPSICNTPVGLVTFQQIINANESTKDNAGAPNIFKPTLKIQHPSVGEFNEMPNCSTGHSLSDIEQLVATATSNMLNGSAQNSKKGSTRETQK